MSWQKNPDQWKATDAYHKSKGWGGGGYNYEVSAKGWLHQFRADGAVTTAQYQRNMNDGRALSICLDGFFDIEDPTPEQKATVRAWLMEKMDKYKIPKENVFPHREVALYKSCPGKRIPADVYSYFMGQTVSTATPIPETPKNEPKEPTWLSKTVKVLKRAIPSHWF